MDTVITIAAEYTGEPTRYGPVTMGQANMARCVLRDPPLHMNFRVVKRLPAGTTLDTVTASVGRLLSRHEGLRATIHSDTQCVSGSGALPIEVHDAEPGGGGSGLGDLTDLAGLAEEVGLRMQGTRFDVEAELPIRVAVITERNVPRLAVFVLPHTSVDAIGLATVMREWERLIRGGTVLSPCPTQPLELAEAEGGPLSQRRTAAALRHWETQLRRVPQSMFAIDIDEVPDADAIRPRLRVRSAVAGEALGAIASRTGASRSAVVLAALGVLIGLRNAQRTCVIASLASNRVRPELRDYVGPLAQDALMAADLDVSTFDEAIRRFRTASLTGYQHSRFDSTALWEVIETVNAERGVNFARDCVFNDMSGVTVSAHEPAPSAEIECDWLPAASLPAHLALWANRLEDDEVDLTFWIDPRVMTRAEAEVFGTGLVKLLIRAGDRTVHLPDVLAISGVVPVEYGPGWIHSDSCWVNLDAVERLVGEAVGGRPHRVIHDANGRLTCHVSSGTPEEIHAACLALLQGRTSAMAPHHYVIHAPGPGDTWLRGPVIAEGDGRDFILRGPRA
ncbi:condensation domain-containing protein [Streptosporangium subroseum]|uniref:condensation domain-containing protein n=1 Tax=Streptosporangium subroseum TaxID=106412 RepID=UPI00308F230F|nr:condensation domain-containing protein [Streptosporangium subroseum]